MEEQVGAKFVGAWEVFTATCAQFIAPEQTYQAWFAHYLISQFGIDRVAREPIIKFSGFADTPWKQAFRGGEVRLDAVVMKRPGVHLPHYANRFDRAADSSGLMRVREMAVISELKVSATQGGGLGHREVAQDAYKLSMLISELEGIGVPAEELPIAFVCVLDNHPTKPYGWSFLDRYFERTPLHPRVRILPEDRSASRRPALLPPPPAVELA